MPILVRYLNDPLQECVIRPAPLVSISPQVNRTKEGILSSTYQITLTGTIIADLGFPLARDARNNDLFDYHASSGGYVAATGNAGPYLSFDTAQSHAYFVDSLTGNVVDNRPERQYVPFESAVDAILFKQKVIRALFSKEGQRLEISAIHTDEPSIVCYPKYVSCNFTDGIYVDRCDYTITLEADVLYDKDLKVDLDGNPLYLDGQIAVSGGMTDAEIMAASGRFIESFSDNWSLEVDDNFSESPNLVKSYRISRNISATGKDYWTPTSMSTDGRESVEKRHAWEQARDYVQFRLQNEPLSSGYPNVMGQFGSGLINLVNAYEGFNHQRTESISIADGTYSVTEDWLLSSGSAYENYNMSISASIDNPFITVSIDGEIKGLSSFSPTSSIYGGSGEVNLYTDPSGAYANALSKYHEISNSGTYGIGCSIYKRANNSVAVELNAQPKSVSLSVNERAGTINYALEYDNRPTNIFSGVLSETISISDTYPGDVFSIIPVIGRSTGPILNYGSSRTEYRRSVNVGMLLDYNQIPYGSGRSILTQKPSLVEPIRSQLIDLLQEVSPFKEPNIRKYFLDPGPSEEWEPKTGNYSLNLSWTYELDK